MSKHSQNGALSIALLLILITGIALGTLLTFKPQIFKPRAMSVLSAETSITLQTERFGYETGEEFPVKIFVRSDITPADYFSALINFDENKLEVSRVDYASLDARFAGKWKWIEREYDNENGKITLTGAIYPNRYQSSRDVSLIRNAYAHEGLSIPNVYIDQNFLVVECVGCGKTFGTLEYRVGKTDPSAVTASDTKYSEDTEVLRIKVTLQEALNKKISKGGQVRVCTEDRDCSGWREIDSKSFAIPGANAPEGNAEVSSPVLIQGGSFVMASIIFRVKEGLDSKTSVQVSDNAVVKLSGQGNLLDTRRDISIEIKKSDQPTLSGTELGKILQTAERENIKDWGKGMTIAQLNGAVFKLTSSEKDKLAGVILNIVGESSADQEEKLRGILKLVIKQIFSKKDLGFYAEILSYTDVNVDTTGFFGNCYKAEIPESYIIENGATGALRDVLMHEAFHSFNCVNGGPGESGGLSHANPLDEGSAIWITKFTFPQGRFADELDAGWAETTYGTKNYYRDVGIEGSPRDIPLVTASNPTKKLKDVYTLLAANDPSRLPWNSKLRLQNCYEKHYQGLDRNTDFASWVKLAANASKIMTWDLECRPL